LLVKYVTCGADHSTFFFQAEDGIRDRNVTGVQTCALPISSPVGRLLKQWRERRRISQLGLAVEAEISTRHLSFLETGRAQPSREIGRASCREECRTRGGPYH